MKTPPTAAELAAQIAEKIRESLEEIPDCWHTNKVAAEILPLLAPLYQRQEEMENALTYISKAKGHHDKIVCLMTIQDLADKAQQALTAAGNCLKK